MPTVSTEIGIVIAEHMRFQRAWQRRAMMPYILTTIVTVVCSTAATLLAALKISELAAMAAALATVSIGIEETPLVRERWRFHLSVATRLEPLHLAVLSGQLHRAGEANTLTAILEMYADNAPFPQPRPREASS